MELRDDIRILVLQRGWVCVGRFSREGAELKLSDAACVRRWGTSKGLGQLAAEGPLKETVLDPCPPVRVHELAVVLSIDCNPEKWAHALRR